MTSRRFKIVIHASVILCGHFSTSFCKFQLHSNRDFVVVVLLSLLQLQASLRIRTAVVSKANLSVLCCCVFRHTVGILFSFRPIRYRPNPPYRGPHCDSRCRIVFFPDPFVGVAIKFKNRTRYTSRRHCFHVVVVVNRWHGPLSSYCCCELNPTLPARPQHDIATATARV